MTEEGDPRLVHVAESLFEYEDRRDCAWAKYFGDERSAGYLRYHRLIMEAYFSELAELQQGIGNKVRELEPPAC